MQKWEYKAVIGLSDSDLNKLGMQGWELVVVTVFMLQGSEVRRFYFKRPKT